MTDWSRFTVPMMWQLLSPDDGEITDEQVSTWDALHRDMQQQAQRLDEIGTRIAATWPPEHSPAAQAFSDLLADIRDSTRSSADAAAANGSALRAISGAVQQTRGTISHLLGQYWDENAARRNYRGEVSAFERFWDSMPWANEEQKMWQVHHHVLSEQGRAAMLELDQAAFEAKGEMVSPPLPPDIDDPDRWPPPAEELPAPPTTSRFGGFSGAPAVSVPDPVNVAPPPLPKPVPGPDFGFVIGGGPVLTPVDHPGGGTVLVPVDQISPALVGAGPPGAAGHPGVVPGTPPLPGGQPLPGQPPAIPIAPPAPETAQWVVPTPTGPALRPGGVVGAPSGAQPVAGRTGGVTPVFPPGGVVGPPAQRLPAGGVRAALTNPATIYPMPPPAAGGGVPPRAPVPSGPRGGPVAGPPMTVLPAITGSRPGTASPPPVRTGPPAAPTGSGAARPFSALTSPGLPPAPGRSRTAGTPDARPARLRREGTPDHQDEGYLRLADQHRQRRDRAAAERRNPSDPWQVEDGMPPVITPPEERPHDPGPGVVGIDR